MGWNGGLRFTSVMVMELLGRSLGSISRQYKKLPIWTVLQMGIEMMKAIQYVHERGIIHRDIKPDNMCLDLTKSNKIFLVDFGLAYRYTYSGQHII